MFPHGIVSRRRHPSMCAVAVLLEGVQFCTIAMCVVEVVDVGDGTVVA